MKKNTNIEASKKVFIYSHACRKRNLDAQKMSTYFMKNNYELVNGPENADYIIFVTCAYISTTTEVCLKVIRKFEKYDAELIVAGCLPDIAGDRLREIFNGRIVTTKDIDKIDEIFEDTTIKFRYLKDEHILWRNYNPIGISGRPVDFFKKLFSENSVIKKLNDNETINGLKQFLGNTFPSLNRWYEKTSGVYFLSISRGCIHNCSYCTIIKAIGPLKSKPIEQCIKEFKFGLESGYLNFVLDADDSGPYGIDIGTNLAELLDELTKIDGNYTIQLRNTHPMWIIKYCNDLENILKRGKIKDILVSIQSGNNRILKLMRRNYTREALLDVIPRLKEAYPDLKIRMHCMIGFPSETRQEFKETLDIINKLPVHSGSIFPFSEVKNTEASAIKPKIHKKEIQKRMRIAVQFLKQNNHSAVYKKIFSRVFFHSIQ